MISIKQSNIIAEIHFTCYLSQCSPTLQTSTSLLVTWYWYCFYFIKLTHVLFWKNTSKVEVVTRMPDVL